MTEEMFVYNPLLVQAETVATRAKELGVPQVVCDLAPWMVERGDITFGRDGTVIVVLSSVPRRNAAREVLAQLHGREQTRENLDAIEDFPADPTPEPVVTMKELVDRVAALEAAIAKLA